MQITRDMINYDTPDDRYVVTTADGKRYRIEFENDYDSTPLDEECYDESDIGIVAQRRSGFTLAW